MILSIASGAVPSAWKKSRVFPIFRERDHLDTSNYRPISVIPACMKILRNLFTANFTIFFTDYNLLSSNQSGFRTMPSTQTCLLEVTDYLLDNFNSGLYTGVVFLDLKKAFDTVHHKVLLKKTPEHWCAGFWTQLVWILPIQSSTGNQNWWLNV